ncbi:MAG: hypothetical protein ACRD4B_04020, partial [Acidobacteriota bacterium]
MLILRLSLILFALAGIAAAAEEKVTLSGKVQGVDGTPISQAEVSILPLEISVSSDANGEFVLEIPS